MEYQGHEMYGNIPMADAYDAHQEEMKEQLTS